MVGSRDIEVTGNYGHLPIALVEEILSRLPIKSLMQFKCVCKSWYALIHLPAFTSLHLSTFSKKNQHLLARLRLLPDTSLLFSLSSEEDSDFSPNKQISITIPDKRVSLSYHLVSNTCDGIMCVYASYCSARHVALCNPTTREGRLLPQSHVIPKIDNWMVRGIGMGNDLKTNDYKVVRMWMSGYWGGHSMFIVDEYSLSTDSWRKIDVPRSCVFDTCSANCFAMHFNGVYYWWAKLGASTPTILTLEVGGEVFHKVSLPNNIDISNNSDPSKFLGVLNHSIALVLPNYYALNWNFDIWLMDGDCAKGSSSWTKLFTLEHIPCMPLGFWNGNELLLKIYNNLWNNVKLSSYNVDTKEIQDINMGFEGEQVGDILEVVSYEKSIVSIKRRN